ncbi:hypothetical protein P389DRAFT_195641 [Cystobasidium minutum MCA 4210]|uniref:uncharacterized protein n=1 Tax=Cystobasidium minutum MCA 4210 TaxID=1397322 RepID=UPI0034CF222A|eukprot:jgi/Rhomi1/195641/gm1.3855_g
MIPPALREQLVRKLTQKLVESPTFNSLVHNTQGTISAFLEGIDEGRRQKEASELKRSDIKEDQGNNASQQHHTSHRQQYQQPEQPAQSQQQTYSRTHDFEKPRSTSYVDPRTPKPPPPEAETSSSTSSTSSSSPNEPALTELEAFLRRTKASLEEAERRADAQRKNK